MTELIRFLIPVALFFVFDQLLRRSIKPEPWVNEEGQKVVEYGWPLKIFGLVPIALGTFLLSLIPIGDNSTMTFYSWIIFISLILLFVGYGFFLVLETFRSKVYFNSEGLQKNSIWSKNRTFKWKEVTDVSYSTFSRYIAIKAQSGQKIKVPDTMHGFRGLVKEIIKRRKGSYGKLKDLV